MSQVQTAGMICRAILICFFCLPLSGAPPRALGQGPTPTHHYGDLPLSFEKNVGQAANDADFLSHLDRALLLLNSSSVSMSFGRDERDQHGQHTAAQVNWHLLHAAKGVEGPGEDLQDAVTNYFSG